MKQWEIAIYATIDECEFLIYLTLKRRHVVSFEYSLTFLARLL